MTDADHIARIDALTRNARNTWFALLGVLVFVGITLMGVEHIDFYGVNRATKLPLVDVEVPTRYFFVAAPILILAIYGYFHLYLIRLWDALGMAPPRLDGKRLGDAVAPWLVTDAVLHWRRRVRGDNCTTPRTLEGGAMLLNFLLAWGFGLVILFLLWWLSMPARTFWMTAIAGLCFGLSIIVAASSLSMMAQRMQRASSGVVVRLWARSFEAFGLLVLTGLLLWKSYERTTGPAANLAELNLYAENLVEKPLGWLPHDLARKDFLKDWCDREVVEDCKKLYAKQQREFDEEWKTRRDGALAGLTKPDWHKKETKPNFRNANLTRSFLSGANLNGAQMEGAVLIGAQMEKAKLTLARMQKADLSEAQMEGAVLIGAQMEGAVLLFTEMKEADLREAQLKGSDLRLTEMKGADLSGAQLESANLRGAQMKETFLLGAQMEGATLRMAQMEGAILDGAQMEGADLRRARMEGATLRRAQMEGATLSFSLLTGTATDTNILQDTNIRASTNNGGALRFVDLRLAIFDARTDFRNAFMDGSVELPDGFADRMGGLCQRMDETLDDPEFYGRWRGWIEAGGQNWTGWRTVSPPGWENITAIPPPDGCGWKTGPLPGSEPAE